MVLQGDILLEKVFQVFDKVIVECKLCSESLVVLVDKFRFDSKVKFE